MPGINLFTPSTDLDQSKIALKSFIKKTFKVRLEDFTIIEHDDHSNDYKSQNNFLGISCWHTLLQCLNISYAHLERLIENEIATFSIFIDLLIEYFYEKLKNEFNDLEEIVIYSDSVKIDICRTILSLPRHIKKNNTQNLFHYAAKRDFGGLATFLLINGDINTMMNQDQHEKTPIDYMEEWERSLVEKSEVGEVFDRYFSDCDISSVELSKMTPTINLHNT